MRRPQPLLDFLYVSFGNCSVSFKDICDELWQVGRVVQPCFAIVNQILNLRCHGSKKVADRFRQKANRSTA